MSFDPSEVLPWEAVAVVGANGEPEPVAARHAAPPVDEYVAPWTPADWHVTDPALASRHAHRVAEAARERAETRARVEARRAASAAPVATPAPRPAGSSRAVPVAGLPGGVELRRLAAAALLTPVKIGAGQYRVTGGAEPHHVDLDAEGAAPVCDCADATLRGQYRCKHELAARAAAGEAPIGAALAVLGALVRRGALAPARSAVRSARAVRRAA